MDPTETSDSHDAEVQGLKGGGQLSIEHRYPASRGSLARCSGVDVLWRQGESMLPACLGCLGTLYLVGHLRPNISYREEAGCSIKSVKCKWEFATEMRQEVWRAAWDLNSLEHGMSIRRMVLHQPPTENLRETSVECESSAADCWRTRVDQG